MISEIQIENFKSIAKLSIKPGAVTVLIGENGSGKSNILEAIAFGAAASADKLDDEFLFTRGIRVADPKLMQSAFQQGINKGDAVVSPIIFRAFGTEPTEPFDVEIIRAPNIDDVAPEGSDFLGWMVNYPVKREDLDLALNDVGYAEQLEIIRRIVEDELGRNSNSIGKVISQVAAHRIVRASKREKASSASASLHLRDFLIYAPENSVLRNLETEGAIKPLGTKGEGLLKLLLTTAARGNGKFASELNEHLSLLGWFGDLQLPTEEDELRGRVRIQDRWLTNAGVLFDQRSANEGFLYLLFYFTLFLSKQTPTFFAIDNIDNSLNPKLCSELMRQLAVLAVKSGKQVICTTHNPAILDGLNLHDDQQRLYVVRRDSEGHTMANRVSAPRARPDGPPIKLSQAFMSGLIGGVPDHF